jgi:NTE family protein
VFFKCGPFSRLFWQLGRSFHRPLKPEKQYADTLTRLYNDTVDLVMSALTPTTLNYFSKGICTRVGALDDQVAWDRLKTYPKEFYLNAFDLETQQLEVFDKTSLNPTTFWAALAMPWLFEPASANGKTYTEGASHDPAGLEALNAIGFGKLDKIIALDSVGPELWTDPENIYDALQTTIIDPIVSLGECVLAAYGMLEYFINESSGQSSRFPKLYRVPFQTPDWETPHILEWSYSNALTLWHAGHQAADNFADTLLAEARDPVALERYRYYPSMKNDKPRIQNFLTLFDGIEGALPAVLTRR